MSSGKKRAQISVFLIVAVLILVLGGLLLVKTNKPRVLPAYDLEGADTEPVRGTVNLCLKQELIEGAQLYGFNKKDKIEKHIESEIKSCVDSSALKKQGLDANVGKPLASVDVSGTVYTASLNLPITVSKGSSRTQITSFSATLKREQSVALSNSPEGLTSPVSMVTSDGTFELKIEKGTKLAGKESSVKELKVTTNDKRYNGIDNSIVLGGITYDISPDGITLDRPAKITIYYNKETLPKGVNPDTLAIAYYDESKERWAGLQSTVEKEKGSVTATTSHFSWFAVTMNCAPSENNEPQTIYLGWVYREPCYSGDRSSISCQPEWIKGSDGSIYAPQGANVYLDTRFTRPLRDNERPSCYKRDWDKNPETPDTYGYPDVNDVGGKGSFLLKFTQENGNTCVFEKEPIKIKVECDDACTYVKFNGKELKQENDVYVVPDDKSIKPAGEDNVIEFEVSNAQDHCSGVRATLELTGTGLLPECGQGLITRNCRCGTGQNIAVNYDYDKLHEVMEDSGKSYSELEEEELKEAMPEGTEAYCCSGLAADKPCAETEAAAKQEEAGQEEAGGQGGQGEQEQPPAQTEKKAFDCTVQERINYLCRYGQNNEEAYNPEYPKCSGEVEGRKVGFSDRAIAAEMGYLSQQTRDSKLIELPEYDSEGKYYGNAFCTLEQATGQADTEQAAETGEQGAGEAKPEEAAAAQALEPSEPGTVEAEGFSQKAYLGNNLWQSCTKESLGLTTNINGKEGYDLLCRKNGDWYEFTECDTDNKQEHTGEHGGIAKQGTIYEVKGNDYMCAESNGYERWAKCGGAAYTTDKTIYVPDSSSITASGKSYYCCTDQFRTTPCSQVAAKRQNLCLHTELNSGLVSEDKELELARSIGAEYVKQTFEWSAVQHDGPNSWDWSMFDRWYGKIRAKNLKVIARLSGAPGWARTEKGVNTGYTHSKCNPSCGSFNRPDMDKIDYYGEYVKMFVERYKPDYVQIWNEENLAFEWGENGPNPAEYAVMLKVGYNAAKNANKNTKVTLGALAPTDTDTFRGKVCEAAGGDKEEACVKSTNCEELSKYIKLLNDEKCGDFKKGNVIRSYSEVDYLAKLYEADPDIGNYYDVLGINSHPFPETSPSDKCGVGQIVALHVIDKKSMAINQIDCKEDENDKTCFKRGFLLAPLGGPGGDCRGFDRVRLVHEYLKNNLKDDKPVAVLEFSYYLNAYFAYSRDLDDTDVLKDEESRQAKKLEEGYKIATTEWKDWAGPVCWFLTSSNPRWDTIGNMFRCDASKCDYEVRPAACSYAAVADKPIVSSLAPDCAAGAAVVT
ncbi:hypothetical protein HYV82_00265 [Candidatus Woesearchaeota archaeon]|nr:hypothetical protein [Candidatus Woesearchaeota archaeon]